MSILPVEEHPTSSNPFTALEDIGSVSSDEAMKSFVEFVVGANEAATIVYSEKSQYVPGIRADIKESDITFAPGRVADVDKEPVTATRRSSRHNARVNYANMV